MPHPTGTAPAQRWPAEAGALSTVSDLGVRPGLVETARLAREHDLVALVQTIPAADTTGPRMLAAVGDRIGAFLFESASGEGEFARFTFAGLAGPGAP